MLTKNGKFVLKGGRNGEKTNKLMVGVMRDAGHILS